MYNTRSHEKADASSRVKLAPFEMIDKDSNSHADGDSTSRPRNRGRGGGGGAGRLGFGKKKAFDDLGHSTDDDDDEMLLGRRHNEEDYNSSDIEDENDGDGDLFKPLLNTMTIDFKYFWSQFKSVGPKLVPFLKTLGIYFVMFIPVDRPSAFAMLIKCLPVASLALFVLLHGISFRDE